MDLNKQVVVVTGAGTGIGRATALRFAAAGATVIANGRRIDKLDETANHGADITGNDRAGGGRHRHAATAPQRC